MEDGALRLALPIDVFATPHPYEAGRFTWTHSGVHLLEVETGPVAHLHFRGMIKTAEADGNTTYPPYVIDRSVLHDDSIFVINGANVISGRWTGL